MLANIGVLNFAVKLNGFQLLLKLKVLLLAALEFASKLGNLLLKMLDFIIICTDRFSFC